MPVFRNGSLVVYSLHVGEVCTTKAIDPPCYALPPDLPPGVRVRLLAFEVGCGGTIRLNRDTFLKGS